MAVACALAAGYAALGGVVVVWVTGWSWWFGTAVSVGLIAVLYALDDRTVLPKHLTRVATEPEQEPVLHAVVDRLCALSGVSKPKLKVIEVRWANAVAFRLPGRRPTIAVTRGLLCSSTALGVESGLGQPFEPRFRRSRRHRRKRHPDHAHDRDGCGQASVDTSRLEAVLAHELAHIAHRDASVMPFVTPW